jgi:hypothetical protein
LKEKIIFLEQPVGALPFHKEEEKWPVYMGNRPKTDTDATPTRRV